MTLFLGKTRYLLIEEQRRAPELGAYRSFGILAVRNSFRGYEGLAYVPDVSTDRAYAAALARRYDRAKLSPSHLWDFILDELGRH